MFDDLIDIAFRNWDVPLSAFFMDLIYGPSVFFGVPSMAGFSKRSLVQLLERNSIEVWGDLYDGDMIIFSVRKDQAKQAFKVLTVAEVPILFPKLYESDSQ